MNGKTIFAYKEYVRINGLDGEMLVYDKMKNPETAQYGDTIAMPSAKNQTVAFQIGFAPKGGVLENLDICWSELKAEDGSVIGKDCFALYTEWFHTLDDLLAPDCLYPFENEKVPFRIPLDKQYLSAQKAGAVWFDIWIAPETKPGTYCGVVNVNADGDKKEFALSIEVGDFSVPKENKIVADLNNYASSRIPHFQSVRDNENKYTDGSYIKMEHEFFKLSRDHRALFHLLPYTHTGTVAPVFVPELEGEGKYIRVKSWETFDAFYGPLLDGSLFEGSHGGAHPLEVIYLPFNYFWPASYEKWGSKGYRTEFRRILTEFVRHFEEKGWDKTVLELFLNSKKDFRTVPYTVDEVWYEHDQQGMLDFGELLEDIYDTSTCRFRYRMDSSNYFGQHYNSRYSDVCDMWIAGFSMFNWYPDSAEVMKQKDNILWIYGGSHNAISENMITMYSWPAYCQMMGPTGFVVWNTTGFGPDPLKCPLEQGGQNLFYPGDYFGIDAPLPCIRLKNLRNAMQTTELAMTLQGTRMNEKAEALANRVWGKKDRDDWFVAPPAFADTPPRYWDFGSSFGDYCATPLHQTATPDAIEELRDGVYALFAPPAEAKDKKVAIKYQ